MKQPLMYDMLGTGIMKTNLSLEELAKIISDQLFGGKRFGGKERSIWEEVPAVFINEPILGLLVILGEGRSDEESRNCFVLKINTWGDLDRYSYHNKIPEKRIRLDGYLYHLLKFGLRRFPEVEIVEPEIKENKEYLFRLVEQVVDRIEDRLDENKELTGFMSFTESVITRTSVKIVFSNTKGKIICSFSTHPLDMPLGFQVKIISGQGHEFELHNWRTKKNGNEEAPYEVPPAALCDPESWGEPVGRIIANDIIAFYREVLPL